MWTIYVQKMWAFSFRVFSFKAWQLFNYTNNFENIKEKNEIDPIIMKEHIKYLTEFSNDLKELNNKNRIRKNR